MSIWTDSECLTDISCFSTKRFWTFHWGICAFHQVSLRERCWVAPFQGITGKLESSPQGEKASLWASYWNYNDLLPKGPRVSFLSLFLYFFLYYIVSISGSCLVSLWQCLQQKVELMKTLSLNKKHFSNTTNSLLNWRKYYFWSKICCCYSLVINVYLVQLAFSLQILFNISGRCFNWHPVSWHIWSRKAD